MNHNLRKSGTQQVGEMIESESRRFAQAILGRPVTDQTQVDRAQREWLADISQKHAAGISELDRREAEDRRQRDSLAWLAEISSDHEVKFYSQSRKETDVRDPRQDGSPFEDEFRVQEVWSASKHPRLGGPPNAGWWAATGGSGAGATSNGRARAIKDVADRGVQSQSAFAAIGGATSPAGPTFGIPGASLPKVGAGASAGAGAAAGVAAGSLAAAARNASMGSY